MECNLLLLVTDSEIQHTDITLLLYFLKNLFSTFAWHINPMQQSSFSAKQQFLVQFTELAMSSSFTAQLCSGEGSDKCQKSKRPSAISLSKEQTLLKVNPIHGWKRIHGSYQKIAQPQTNIMGARSSEKLETHILYPNVQKKMFEGGISPYWNKKAGEVSIMRCSTALGISLRLSQWHYFFWVLPELVYQIRSPWLCQEVVKSRTYRADARVA